MERRPVVLGCVDNLAHRESSHYVDEIRLDVSPSCGNFFARRLLDDGQRPAIPLRRISGLRSVFCLRLSVTEGGRRTSKCKRRSSKTCEARCMRSPSDIFGYLPNPWTTY